MKPTDKSSSLHYIIKRGVNYGREGWFFHRSDYEFGPSDPHDIRCGFSSRLHKVADAICALEGIDTKKDDQ